MSVSDNNCSSQPTNILTRERVKCSKSGNSEGNDYLLLGDVGGSDLRFQTCRDSRKDHPTARITKRKVRWLEMSASKWESASSVSRTAIHPGDVQTVVLLLWMCQHGNQDGHWLCAPGKELCPFYRLLLFFTMYQNIFSGLELCPFYRLLSFYLFSFS